MSITPPPVCGTAKALVLFVLGMGGASWAQCPSPILAAWPAHGEGQGGALQWRGPAEAEGFQIWAQWRVPEAEVVHTLEQTVSAAEFPLPPSPEPWRLLKLQIEIVSLCKGGLRSRPALLRQFQSAPTSSCQPPALAEGVSPQRADSQLQLRWQARDTESLALRWSLVGEASARSSSPEVVVLGPELRLPLEAPQEPLLVQAQRLCSAKQRSAVSYWLVP